MRFLHKLAMAAGVFCAPSLATAQYYSYGAPATLPAPVSPVRHAGYNGGAYPTYSGETAQAPTAVPENVTPPTNHYDAAPSAGPGCSTCNGGASGAGDYGWEGGDGYGAYGWGEAGFGGACGCGPCWYGSVAGLYMERNRPNPYQVSFDTTNPVGELILNVDTVDDWQAGFEVRVGKYIGCNSAIELGYWTLDNFGGEAVAFDPVGVGGLNTPFDFRSLNFNGTPVNDLYDGAQAHRLRRSDEIHNIEINFVNFPMACNPCSRLQMNWLAGLRFFTFRESWEFATADTQRTFGADPANEAYYNIEVDNNLYGLQLGGRASFAATQKLSAFAAPRAGIFWNNISHDSNITSGNGISALSIGSDRDVVSVLAQLDVGLNYQFSPCVGIWGGYRVMAISGIALADAQVPYLADDAFGISDVDHNSNLVLHGFMGGVTVTF